MALNEKFITVEHLHPVKPGGQHVGMISTGIRISHVAGISIECEVARSQVKNKNIALAAMEYALLESGIKDEQLFKKDE